MFIRTFAENVTVPAFVNPPEKVHVEVLVPVVVNEPPETVTSPVKAFVHAVVPSVNVPAVIEVVPVTLKLEAPIVNVVPPNVRLPPIVTTPEVAPA